MKQKVLVLVCGVLLLSLRGVPPERESRVFQQAAAPAEAPVFAGHDELCVFHAGRGTDGVLERHIGQRPDGGEGEDRAFFRAQGAR